MRSRAVPWAIVAVAAAASGFVLRSPLVVGMGPTVILAAGWEVDRRRVAKQALALEQHRLQAVEHILQTMSAGASLHQACVAVGPESGLQPLVDGLRNGRPLTVAASSLLGDGRDPMAELIGASLFTLATNGGPATPALRRTQDTLRMRIDRRRRASAQAAQAISSAAMLALAPAGFALLLASVESKVAELYWREPLGLICVLGAAVLAGIGWGWIHRSVRRVQGGEVGRFVRASARVRRELAASVDLTVDLVAVVLGSGGTIYQAVASVAAQGPIPVRPWFRLVLAKSVGGFLLADALRDVSPHLGPEFGPALDTLRSAQTDGAPVEAALDRLTDQSRARGYSVAEAGAGRLSVALVPPLVLCFLPALILGSIVPLVVVSLRSIQA